MEFKYFDVHAHLFVQGAGFEVGYEPQNFKELRQELQDKHIGVLNCGIDRYTNEILISQLEGEYIFGATGFHPTEAHEYDETLLIRNLKHPKVLAIGEVGFDDYALKKQGASDREIKIAIDKQVEIFERQVKLAKQYQKSLSIHLRGSRQIFQLAVSELARLAPLPRTNLHFFSGSHKLVRPLLDLGCYFSFGGALLTAPDIQNLFKLIPLGRLLTETDSPFGHPARDGRQNRPSFVLEIVQSMGERSGQALDEQIVSNSLRYLQLDLR